MIATSPLAYLGLHAIPALPRFAPRESIGFGTLEDTAAPWAGEHFRKNLLESVEDASEPVTVREHRLRIGAHDFQTDSTCGILDELGGLAWASIGCGQFWHLLSLLSRQQRYMAYVRTGDTVFGVHAAWVYKGRQTIVRSLFIESGEIKRPYGWGEGCHVLSR